nr:MAM33 domain-containing protein [Zea mays]
MFLRRLRTSAALRRGATTGGVLAAVRAELANELSSSAPPPFRSELAPDFDTVSDAPRAQDVLLRRRAGSEEVLVSALLAPLRFVGRDPLPRAALVKVFVSKPGAPPVLHFDCRASWVGEEERGGGAADYAINAVRYHSSPGAGGEDEYEGPAFRDLDPRLQAALREYLVARGFNSKLASSILQHLLRKERNQYVNWLKTLEEAFAKHH